METAPPQPQRPTLIVVLGMHRSGTSVTTRAMETMGASFGDNLIPTAYDNPKRPFQKDCSARLKMFQQTSEQPSLRNAS